MRVGIITLYRGYNYGTSLQAYALKKYIASLGYDAQIIWSKENTTAGRDIRIGKIIRIVRRSCFRPKLFKHTFLGYKNSIAAEIPTSIKRRFLEFTQRELQVEGMSMRNLKKFASSEKTVAVVCGSDQIWSAAGANVEPLYFLRFVPREKRVAYAPSFGSSTVPSYNRNLLKKYLEDIPKISIREEQGAKIIAPCSHQGKCGLPKDDWCSFYVRVARTGIQRLSKKGELGYEDEKFSYIAFSKTQENNGKDRILRHPQIRQGHIKIKLCTSNGIEERTITKKDGQIYKKVKKLDAGDILY